MGVISDAIHNKMWNDTKLTSLLTNLGGTYLDPVTRQWVTEYKPAIFSYEIAFDSRFQDFNKLKGFIIHGGNNTDSYASRFASKSRKGRDITRDIRCYFQEPPNPTEYEKTFGPVEAIAERVYELFHNKTLTIPDPSDPANYTKWQAVKVTCNGPIVIPSERQSLLDKRIDNMVVTLNLTIIEKP